VGGGTALLGPGLGLMLVATLDTPAYFARIAWRLALRAARTSSTGGGDGGRSSSISNAASVDLLSAVASAQDALISLAAGERLGRGEILQNRAVRL